MRAKPFVRGCEFILVRLSVPALASRRAWGCQGAPWRRRASRKVGATAGLDCPCAGRDRLLQAGTKERLPARTKELHEMRKNLDYFGTLAT